MLIQNMTQSQATLAGSSPSFSTATAFPIQHQSQLSPSDKANLVFGCVASVLGILTLWGTFWLGRLQALREAGDGASLGSYCDESTDQITNRQKLWARVTRQNVAV